MTFIQRSIELKWPVLLVEVVVLIVGIMLIASGIRIRKQSKLSALISLMIGTTLALVSLYLLFWTFLLGYNS